MRHRSVLHALNFLLFFVLGISHLTGEEVDRSKQAMQDLIEGNQRFVSGKSVHRDLSQEALSSLKGGQMPKAVIVGCSDSRVSPELIFDQGLGDLFIVRVAGNVIGPIELESILFGVQQLQAPFILVLGHENCAAVKAALQKGAKSPDLAQIDSLITPALKSCRFRLTDPVMNAIWCNAMEGVRRLKASPVLKPFLEAKKLEIRGGYYEFDRGTVQIISEP